MRIFNVIIKRDESMVFFNDIHGIKYSTHIYFQENDDGWLVSREAESTFRINRYFKGVTLEGPPRQELELVDAELDAPTPPTVPHYYNKALHGVTVDIYRIAQLYDLGNGPRYHMVKKLLRGTSKDSKTELELIQEQRGLLARWEDMINEDLQFASENGPSTNSD